MGVQQLSEKEERVLDVLKGRTFRPDRKFEAKDRLTIAEIATRGFPHVRPKAKAESWVRNALRALVELKLAKKVDRGTYKATLRGKQTITEGHPSRKPAKRPKAKAQPSVAPSMTTNGVVGANVGSYAPPEASA